MLNQKLGKAWKRGLEYSKERSKSHMRQWEALNRCWQLIQQQDPELPKMAMRMRDDVAVAEEFQPFLERPRGMYVPSCESYNGLNDKACIISGVREVQKYFTQPLAMMRQNVSEVLAFHRNRTANPLNPESVLYATMNISGVPIFKQDYFPIKPITMLATKGKAEPTVKMCHVQDPYNLECFAKDLWERIGTNAERIYKDQHWKHYWEAYLCVPFRDDPKKDRAVTCRVR
eukprot:Skav222596  [mRNA]  locus=scaffold1852:113510:114199:- [translate_table: standard]